MPDWFLREPKNVGIIRNMYLGYMPIEEIEMSEKEACCIWQLVGIFNTKFNIIFVFRQKV